MALHWDISKVKDTHLLHNTAPEKGGEPPFPKGSPEDIEGDVQWAITDALIWATMGVDMGSITEKNIDEFYTRLVMMVKASGPLLHKGGEPYHISYEDVRRRIGLSTNVSTKTPAQFNKRMAEMLRDRAGAQMANEKRKLEARVLIAGLKAGDDWTGDHDTAARVLGLDPDNYRAADNDSWPEDMRGKVTFETGQQILDHLDQINEAKKVMS